MESNQHRNKSKDEKSNSAEKNIERKAHSSGDEKENKEQNRNWDQAQRRQQASPRSYSENTDSENIENQNTRARDEQVDEDTHNDRNSTSKKVNKILGDKVSERQQTIDEKDAPKDKE